jgi:hypothetical protein
VRQANAGDLALEGSIVFGCADRDGSPSYVYWSVDEGDTTTELTADWSADNRFGTDPMLPAAATNLTAPDFVPPSGSPAASMAVAVPTGSIFEAAAYVGAFEPGGTDWTDGWTSFPVAAE